MPSSESVLLVPNALAVADENKGVCGLLVGHGVDGECLQCCPVWCAEPSAVHTAPSSSRLTPVTINIKSTSSSFYHLDDIAGDIACLLRYQTALGSGNILGWNRIGYDMI